MQVTIKCDMTHIAMANPPCMLSAVTIEHRDQLLNNRKGGLKVNDSSHGKEHLHQEGAHGRLDLLPGTVQEELGTLLDGRDGVGTDLEDRGQWLTCRKANHCSSSSTGNILTRMKLIPSIIAMMVAEPWAGFRISRKNRRLTEWNRA